MKFVCLIIISVLLFSCSTVTDEQNQKKESPKENLRVVSLVPSFTTEIIDLGLKDIIIGATTYCSVSKENPDLIVGSVIDINEEKILLLKPDIVFASTLVKQKSIKILTNNGIKVVFFDSPTSFEELCEQMIEIGEVLDHKDLAGQYVNLAKHRLDSLRKLVPNNEIKPKVFFQIGAKPIAAVIPNTFMQDFMDYANCENIFADLDQIIVSRESIVIRNPDYIILSLMGEIGELEKALWLEEHSYLLAVKNNNIIDVPLATTPTVNEFVNNFEIIINEIYFKK